jgi:hypothetical protein
MILSDVGMHWPESKELRMILNELAKTVEKKMGCNKLFFC